VTKAEVIQGTAAFVQERFSGEGTGHDWWHMHRVWQLSKHIAKTEQVADLFVVELAALLHDIADWKFHDGDMEAGPRAARSWLESLSVDESIIRHVEEIIRHISFKGAGVKPAMRTLEGKIVHDADKLDAMGAIGIGRAFAYGGAAGRAMYDPNDKPKQHASFQAYKNSRGTTINHFYEKLLLLKERMYTAEGKRLATRRHWYLKQFLAEFYNEWDGKR
jgi:uncharacterized protein